MSRGPRPAHPIKLTAPELEELRRVARLRNAPYVQVLRAKILLTAYEHPKWSNAQISRTLGCSYDAVRKWRDRWREASSIKDAGRSGAPRFFSLSPESVNHGSRLHTA